MKTPQKRIKQNDVGLTKKIITRDLEWWIKSKILFVLFIKFYRFSSIFAITKNSLSIQYRYMKEWKRVNLNKIFAITKTSNTMSWENEDWMCREMALNMAQ